MESFTINFSIEEMRIIDEALGNMPYKKAAPIIESINTQISEARNTKAEVLDTKEYEQS